MSQGHASWLRRLDVSLRCAHRKGQQVSVDRSSSPLTSRYPLPK